LAFGQQGNLEGQLTHQIALFGYAEQAIGEVSEQGNWIGKRRFNSSTV
jgi:hypothetical protein